MKISVEIALLEIDLLRQLEQISRQIYERISIGTLDSWIQSYDDVVLIGRLKAVIEELDDFQKLKALYES